MMRKLFFIGLITLFFYFWLGNAYSMRIITTEDNNSRIIIPSTESFKVVLSGDPMKGFNCITKIEPEGLIRLKDMDMDFEKGEMIYIYQPISSGDVVLRYMCEEGEQKREYIFNISIH